MSGRGRGGRKGKRQKHGQIPPGTKLLMPYIPIFRMSSSDLVNGPSTSTDGAATVDPVPSPPKPAKAKKRPAVPAPQAKIKRKRTPTDTYQSHIVAAAQQCAGVGPPVEKKEVYYGKGDYLAVRNEEGSYYICQASQNVYKSTKVFKVRWLEMAKSPDIYGLAYYDTVEMDSVLTDVTMERKDKDRMQISRKERERIELVLNKAKQKEEGKLDEQEEANILAMELNDVGYGDDDDEDEEEEEEEEEEDEEDDEEEAPRTKKPIRYLKLKVKAKGTKGRRGRPPKKVTAVGKGKRKRGRPPGSKSKVKTKAIKKEKKKKGKRGRPKMKDKKIKKGKLKDSEDKSKDANRKLKPNTDIEVVNKDPTFEVRGEKDMPTVSPLFNCKRSIRAVLTNDMKQLQEMIADTKKVSGIFVNRSINMEYDAMNYAIINNNHQAIKILGADLKEPKTDRVELSQDLLQAQSTGRYNYRSLGHAVRSISQSRGSREGNDAFTKETGLKLDPYLARSYVRFALEKGVSKSTLAVLTAAVPNFEDYLFDNVVVAVRHGHRKLAGHIIEMTEKSGGYGFNFLHKQVLLYDNEDLSQFRAASVKKKPFENDFIFPLHCAAINPNPKYLSKLLALLPDYNAADKAGRKPIHYAAACEGTGPLELLLSRGMNTEETDNLNFTPLMVAAKAGRTHNIEILMKKIKDAKRSRDEDEGLHVGGIDRANRWSYTALHLAAENGQTDAIRALVKHGATVDKPLSAGRNKMTALMLASAKGNLTIVKILVEAGAAIEKKDKLKRTALIHAVMNGHYPVASYFLRKGANPNTADSSGNTVTHYAAGYGWWYCLKLLIKAGADINTPNEWKTTPLGVAIMKGNTGCADLLLEQEGVDVNFKDENGCTLVMLVAGSPLLKGLPAQIRYLVIDKKADVKITDINKNNALHHLASNSLQENAYSNKTDTAKVNLSLEVAKLLLDNGCDPSVVNSLGESPLVIAIQQDNVELVKLLVEKGSPISTEDNDTSKVGENVLHIMAKQCLNSDLASLIDTIVRKESDDDGSSEVSILNKMSKQIDSEGYTPLLRCGQVYANFDPNVMYHKQQSEKLAMLERGRNMLKALIEKVKADVNTQVVKRQKKHDTDREYDERGLQTLAHILIETKEIPVMEGDKSFERPALDLILKYRPDLNKRNLKGETPLLMAIRAKHRTAAELLVSAGADVNLASEDEKNDGKAPPVVLAAREGLYSVVSKIAKNSKNINAIDNRNKKSALHYTCTYTAASTHEASGAVKALLDSGAQVNIVDDKNCTPLHYAVNSNTGGPDSSIEIEEILLERGANPRAADKYGRLPLHYAFVKMGQHTDKSQIDPIEVVTLLTNAMKNEGVNKKDMFGQTAVHRAAFRGATICILHFTSHEKEMKIVLDDKDNDGNTPLGLAVKGEHDSCSILLIQKNVNTNININYPPEKKKEKKDEDGKIVKHIWKSCQYKMPEAKTISHTLFEKVVQNKWQGVIFLLLEQLHLHNMDYVVAVNSAMEAYTFQLVSSLLRKQKNDAKLQVPVSNKRSLLHTLSLCALQDDDETVQQQCHKICEELMQRGLKVTTKDAYGCTPVHYLGLMQDRKLLKVMLDKEHEQVKECLQIADNLGRLPLVALFWDSLFDEETKIMAKYMLDNGAALDCQGSFPKLEYTDLREHDIAGYDANEWFVSSTLERSSSTPLISAINRQDFDCVKFMLQNGASVNYTDQSHMTPLMHAVKKSDTDIVKLLFNADHEVKGSDQQQVQAFRRFRGHWSRQRYIPGLSNTARRMKQRGVGLFGGHGFPSGQQNGVDDDEDDDDDEDENGSEEMDEDEDNSNAEDEEMQDVEEEDKKKKDKESDFKKTSDIDVAKVDSEGRTAVHHLMKTCDYGTYENVELLKLLAELGVPLDCKDKNGKTALDYAIDSRSIVMANAIQTLLKVDKQAVVKPSVLKQSWEDGLKWDGDVPDYLADSKKMLEQLSVDPDSEIAVLTDDNGTTDTNANMDIGDEVDNMVTEVDHKRTENDNKQKDAVDQKRTDVDHKEQVEEKQAEVDGKTTRVDQNGTEDDSEKSEKIESEDMDTEESIKKSEAESESQAKKEEKKKIVKVPKAFVDERSELQDSGEVYIDKDQNIPYDVLLTKVDVSYGKWGMNNFYKMQLIYQKGKQIYVLFTRWGRIGDEGQYQRTPYQNPVDAIKEFCKVFKAKTGNAWSNVKGFEKLPKKYGLVKAEQRTLRRKELSPLDFSLKSDLPSKLPKYVKDVFDQLTNVEMLRAALHKTNVNTSYMPFGRIPKDVVEKAREVLNKIRVLVDESEKQQQEGMPDVAKYQEAMEKVAELSSEYFQLIPSADYVYEQMEPLNEPDDLKREVYKINNLLDIEVASQVLLGAQYRKKEIHPNDYVYRAVGCQMKLLDEYSDEAQSILKYIQNTGNNVEVEAIFALNRSGEEETLNKCNLDNHMLLWHGTSAANLISILMRGLLVAPPEAPITGYMFGKGIYTADTFAKSENYCYTYGTSSESRFMLLAEVALGKVKEYTEATFLDSPAKGCSSAKGLGMSGPDPKQHLRTPSGALIPQGKIVTNKHPKGEAFQLNWNEYIVYNGDQVCLRYLIMFR